MFETLKHMPIANTILRRPPGVYGAVRRLIARVDRMDADAREGFQNKRLARVLSAARDLPGYAGASGSNTLADWPILNKTQLIGRETDFITKSLFPLIPAATSGTTGQPMKLFRHWRSIVFEQAIIDHLALAGGVNACKSRTAVLRADSIKAADDMKPPYWIDEGPKRRIFSAHHLNAKTICNFKAALRCFEPDIMYCYPASLMSLMTLPGSVSKLHIPLLFMSSESISSDHLNQARDVFGGNVIDFYGHAERVACAWALNGNGYRFLPAYGHIELVPEGGEPDQDGFRLARVIATSLSPHGQIFIRYDTGDLIKVRSHDSDVLRAIALGTEAFHGIEGRSSEYIMLKDGRRITGLNHIPRGVAGAASIQLHQAAEHQINIYIVVNSGFSEESCDVLMRNFRQKFPSSIIGAPIFVDQPVRERNGKAPFFLRTPDPASIHRSQRQLQYS